MAVRCDVDDELDTAERLLSDVWTKEELLTALGTARRLLAETRAVDAPGAGTGAVQALDMSQLLRRMQDVRE
jgi:hypothetical protein